VIKKRAQREQKPSRIEQIIDEMLEEGLINQKRKRRLKELTEKLLK